jgi:hypothetical protein
VFFVHVMKTAGTTFGRALARQFEPGEVYPDPDVDPEDAYIDIRHLLGLPPERHERLRAYRGHLPYFVTEAIPVEVETLVVLRDPVARTLSWLRKRRDNLGTDIALEDIYDDELLRRRMVVDHQTKMLSLEADDQPNTYLKAIEVDQRRLDAALRRLETADVVGIQERFDDFLDAVAGRYGWQLRLPVRHNPSVEHPVDDRLLERIRADVAFDSVLYQRAVELVAG